MSTNDMVSLKSHINIIKTMYDVLKYYLGRNLVTFHIQNLTYVGKTNSVYLLDTSKIKKAVRSCYYN